MANFPLGVPPNAVPDLYLIRILSPGSNLGPQVRSIVPARYLPKSRRVRCGSHAYADYLAKNLYGSNVRFTLRNISGNQHNGRQHDVFVPKSHIVKDSSLPPDMVVLSGKAVHKTCDLNTPPNQQPYLEVVRGRCYP